MTIKRGQGRYQRTPEQKAKDREIREKFRHWHPSPEELIASGEGGQFDIRGEFRGLRDFLTVLKRVREAKQLTLADVSARCGIDQPALSRLENGHCPNPTMDTLWRYAAAVGQRLVLGSEEIEDTRPVSRNARTKNHKH